MVPAALAAGGPHSKVTGDIWFVNGGVAAHWTFDAHDFGATGDRGSVYYADPNGFYHGTITSVHVVDGEDAHMTAEVTHSTYPGITVGMSFSWEMHDGGEPAVGADWFMYGATMLAVTAGNIQVHYQE
jgi:hypothetical protein